DGAPPWRTPGLRPRSGRAGTAGAGCTGTGAGAPPPGSLPAEFQHPVDHVGGGAAVRGVAEVADEGGVALPVLLGDRVDVPDRAALCVGCVSPRAVGAIEEVEVEAAQGVRVVH